MAGLGVPAPLVPRIITALRETYPALTTDRDDNGAVRAVLKYWVTNTLATYEAREAQAAAPIEAQAVLDAYQQAAQEAAVKATADAATIVDPGAPPPAVTSTP